MDSKKTLLALVGDIEPKKKKAKAEEPDTEEITDEEMSDDEGKVAAAEEIMAALESGDAEAFSEAMSAFIEMCSYPTTEDDEEDI